jgi:hypothetical protein
MIPIILLGGGGYSNTGVARTWTLLTALALGVRIPFSIPDNPNFIDYRPDYSILTKEVPSITNRNSANHLSLLISQARLYLSFLRESNGSKPIAKRVPYEEWYDGEDESED